MSVFLMNTLFYKVLILQGEIYYWSPLGLVGCRLKFSYFVGSRLKISIFVGCRLISVNK